MTVEAGETVDPAPSDTIPDYLLAQFIPIQPITLPRVAEDTGPGSGWTYIANHLPDELSFDRQTLTLSGRIAGRLTDSEVSREVELLAFGPGLVRRDRTFDIRYRHIRSAPSGRYALGAFPVLETITAGRRRHDADRHDAGCPIRCGRRRRGRPAAALRLQAPQRAPRGSRSMPAPAS